jgi:hypothetical protein
MRLSRRTCIASIALGGLINWWSWPWFDPNQVTNYRREADRGRYHYCSEYERCIEPNPVIMSRTIVDFGLVSECFS